jgi:predicted acylesterase/phospholipase RssA/ABC-type phosphate/phosphonate transport system substrate-binding protein
MPILCSLLSALFLSPGTAPRETGTRTDGPLDVRVGIVAYQDSRADIEDFQRRFGELAARSPRPLQIHFALGTYGDVLHWMDRKYIDVAVTSPGVFAEALRRNDDANNWRYVATMGLPPATSALAPPERREPGRHFHYRGIAVVRAQSEIQSIADLRRLADQGKLQFLFVHPLSVSGRIAPEFALGQVGIHADASMVQYTYSHSNSLRLVTEPAGDIERVAFVWDDPPPLAAEREGMLRRLPFPELESLLIPQTTIAARTDFEGTGVIDEILRRQAARDGQQEFVTFEDWAERYGRVSDWSRAIGVPAESPEAQAVSLEELGRILLHYARSGPRPPRIALVLSGGGAKCAYQVGAVAALEEKLADLRASSSDAALDIGVVVGTSGGAINALPIALGVTRHAEGRTDFRHVWESLDQKEIVRPPGLIRWNMGLWFVALQASVVLWIARRLVADPPRRTIAASLMFIALAAPQLGLAHIPWTPWRSLGTNHMLHHAWLWGSFGVKWSAWCMVFLGCAGLVFGKWSAVRNRVPTLPSRIIPWLLATGFIGLPALQVATIFLLERTLTDGTGIEHELASRLPDLVNNHLTRVGEPPLRLDNTGSDAAKLQALSEGIIRRGSSSGSVPNPLHRDLVLTGSCLSKTSPDLPNDLYFYAPSNPDQPPPRFGRLGIPLAEHPDKLLDVVMGSGSIFPAFPARTLTDFPRVGQQVELIDGGFAHNSPIEAAVLWGATHIILIEASPSAAEREGQRNFLQNSVDAFNHLYYQAQVADARSKEKVTIFTLRPQPPHICVLDFANNLVERAIDAGYREARGEVTSGSNAITGRPSWQKGLGEPVFLDAR